MKSQALAPQTGRIIEAISRLECIKPFVLVGGTALSIQLKTRQSEDLDFMRWKESKDDTLDIGWPKIQKELETNRQQSRFYLLTLQGHCWYDE